jgi:hypothetical protein
MKALIIALSLLSPLASQAATNVVCQSTGNGGPLEVKITSAQGLEVPSSVVTFEANGILQTVFQTIVGEVLTQKESLVAARVSTLNDEGQVDQNSGIAKVELAAIAVFGEGRKALGTGKITFEKMPPRRGMLRLRQTYDLTGCTGEIE